MIKSIQLLLFLFPIFIGAQGLNIAHENTFLINGGGTANSVYNVEDKIYVFANTVDADTEGVGACIVYDLEGNHLNSYKFDSPDSTLDVWIGQQDGVYYDSLAQEFIFPMLEFSFGVEPRIWRNTIIRMALDGTIQTLEVPNDTLLDFGFFKTIPSQTGGYYACGKVLEDSLVNSDPSGAHGFLMELNENGETLWMQRYDEAWEIKYFDQNENGEFILGGGLPSFSSSLIRRTLSH